jgi:tetratricopeptide (TPR) repeat protein
MSTKWIKKKPSKTDAVIAQPQDWSERMGGLINPAYLLFVLVLGLTSLGGILGYRNKKAEELHLARDAFYLVQEDFRKAKADAISRLEKQGAQNHQTEALKAKSKKGRQVATSRPIKPDGASIYKEIQKPMEALVDVFESYKQTPLAWEMALFIAGVATEGRDTEKARTWYDKALELSPSTEEKVYVWLGLARLEEEIGNYDAARSGLDQALQSNVRDGREALLMQHARLDLELGHHKEAIQSLDTLMAEFPQSSFLEEAEYLLMKLEAYRSPEKSEVPEQHA